MYFRQVAVDRILFISPYRVRTCTACMQKGKGTGMYGGATACLSGRDLKDYSEKKTDNKSMDRPRFDDFKEQKLGME